MLPKTIIAGIRKTPHCKFFAIKRMTSPFWLELNIKINIVNVNQLAAVENIYFIIPIPTRKKEQKKTRKMFYANMHGTFQKFESVKSQPQTNTQAHPIFSCNVTINFCTCKKKQLFFILLLLEIEILTEDSGHVHMKLKCESINFKMGSKH